MNHDTIECEKGLKAVVGFEWHTDKHQGKTKMSMDCPHA